MTVFSDTWDATFEAAPPGTQAANQLDTRIQELKTAVQERLEVEHYHAGDTDDGIHKFPQKTTTTRDALGDDSGHLVFHSDTRGISVNDGSGWIDYFTFSPGDMKMAAYDTAADPGWLKCDGSEVAEATYVALFAAIGTKYNDSPAGGNFNLPNMDGRVPVGKDGGSDFTDVGSNTGGELTHTVLEAELPNHTHTITTDPDGAHTPSWFSNDNTGAALNPGYMDGNNTVLTGRATKGTEEQLMEAVGTHTHTGTTGTGSGSGTAMNVIQPFLTFVWYIKT